MIKRILTIGAAIPLFYVLSYIGFRAVNKETWEKDSKTYVIFPKSPILLYYFYRPLSYLDAQFTGVGAHIGPHQE